MPKSNRARISHDCYPCRRSARTWAASSSVVSDQDDGGPNCAANGSSWPCGTMETAEPFAGVMSWVLVGEPEPAGPGPSRARSWFSSGGGMLAALQEHVELGYVVAGQLGQAAYGGVDAFLEGKHPLAAAGYLVEPLIY